MVKGHRHWVWSIAFSPDGTLLASSGVDQIIHLWRPAEQQTSIALHGHSDWVRSLAFSPDGEMLGSGGNDKTLRLWDVASGQLRYELHGHTHWIWSVAFSSSARILVSSSADSSIRLWDLDKLQCSKILQTPGPYTGLDFSGATGLSEVQKTALIALGAIVN